MKAYKDLSKEELLTLQEQLNKEYEEAKTKGLKLDMSRGKPAASQLDMEMDFMNVLNADSILKTEAGVDCRNYGVMDGIPEARKLIGDVLGVPADNVIVFGSCFNVVSNVGKPYLLQVLLWLMEISGVS